MIVETSAQAVQAVLIVPFLLFGLSHIVQPTMWRQFFGDLHAMGPKGVIYRTFMLEMVPAMSILAFHQVWHGWGLILTLYGLAQIVKISLSLLYPAIGLRSLAMAQTHGDAALRYGGAFLIAMGLLCLALISGVLR